MSNFHISHKDIITVTKLHAKLKILNSKSNTTLCVGYENKVVSPRFLVAHVVVVGGAGGRPFFQPPVEKRRSEVKVKTTE